MLKVSEMKDAVFDGRKMGYVPPKKLSISPKLKLHRKSAKSIDPITYEVIRHSLWHVNEEHGATIQRLSGSPVAMYALDLNPSILTEDGEFVYFGPYMQYMSGVTDTQVKWVIEYRSDNPGIRDGDMFLANDPWVGAAHQKGVMRKILDNGERAFLAKLKRLPDGVWRERSYVECCRPGDRRTHQVMLALRKKGDKLTFENDGTAPQDGAMNATYSGWRGAIMVALNQLLCWDQYFSIGGALRHVEFDPTPGTFNCANFPASVSTAPIQAMEISLYPAYNVLSKMIHADPEMRKDIMCIGGTSQWPATIFRGTDQWGERYGYILVDPIGGAIGAFATGDGISTGGQSRTPICKLPNVEHTEQTFPLLFLYRKEVVDSGGAGRLRGGLSAESCFIPHGTDVVTQDTLSSGNATPTAPGIMGGYPGSVNVYKFKTGTDIRQRLAAQQLIG